VEEVSPEITSQVRAARDQGDHRPLRTGSSAVSGAPPIIMGHSFGGPHHANSCWTAASAPLPWRSARRRSKACTILPLAQAKVASVALKKPGQTAYKTQMLQTGRRFHYGFHQHAPHSRSRSRSYDQARGAGPGRHVSSRRRFANVQPHAVTTVSRHNSSRAPLLFLRQRQGPHRARQCRRAPPTSIQKKTGALTDLKEYPDRSHYNTFSQDGWEEVADYSARLGRAQPRGPKPAAGCRSGRPP